MKMNIKTIIIGLSTVVLGGVAIFTAVRLYQLRSEPIAPNAPQSQPLAQQGGLCGGITQISCASGFTCIYENGSTIAPHPDATGTCQPQNQGANEGEMCGGIAGIDCAKGLVCDYGSGNLSAPNPDATGVCVSETNKSACEAITFTITKATPTPTATANVTSTPTPTPTDTPAGEDPTPTAASTLKPTSTPSQPLAETPTPAPSLPTAGVGSPTIIGLGAGMLILLFSLILAL